MKTIDVRFSATGIEIIKSMVGKKMLKYKCDPFIYSPSVFGIIGVEMEGASYAFTNSTEVMDYYGEQEDVAVFKVTPMPFDKINSRIQNQDMVETIIDSTVTEITIVNETQKLFVKDVQTYEIYVTRGIIFRFEDGHELSFEKNIWFSEDITVKKGYDLIQQFSPTSEFTEGWSGDFHGECSRELISIMSSLK